MWRSQKESEPAGQSKKRCNLWQRRGVRETRQLMKMAGCSSSTTLHALKLSSLSFVRLNKSSIALRGFQRLRFVEEDLSRLLSSPGRTSERRRRQAGASDASLPSYGSGIALAGGAQSGMKAGDWLALVGLRTTRRRSLTTFAHPCRGAHPPSYTL